MSDPDADADATTSSPEPHHHQPPTVAPFAPATAPNSSSAAAFSSPSSTRALHHQVHRKSPLLVATPPPVTRALAQAYPWLRTFNYAAGLLTWSTKDPWESFLLVSVFWFVALYGSFLLRWVGNLCAVAVIAASMLLRRRLRTEEPPSTTLDEMLDTLDSLSARLHLLAAPGHALSARLSSPRSATSSTTRPALTSLFTRMLLATPLWLSLSVWPCKLLTAQRLTILLGTLILTWHSHAANVTRSLLWRSRSVRLLCTLLTGLRFSPDPSTMPPPLPPRSSSRRSLPPALPPGTPSPLAAASVARGAAPGVTFAFAIYENQRRWLGVGWTGSLFAYERAPWTDELLQPCPAPHAFVLPETPRGSGVRWRWLPGEEWVVEGTGGGGGGTRHARRQEVKDRLGGNGPEGEGWWYYDNKWHDGRKGADGWGRYTRRRKWLRRAELVEDDRSDEDDEDEEEANPEKQNETSSRPHSRRSSSAVASMDIDPTNTNSNHSSSSSSEEGKEAEADGDGDGEAVSTPKTPLQVTITDVDAEAEVEAEVEVEAEQMALLEDALRDRDEIRNGQIRLVQTPPPPPLPLRTPPPPPPRTPPPPLPPRSKSTG